MVRSGTSRGSTGSTSRGKRYKYGPSLKPLPQRSYDRSEEEITAISKAEVEAHFAPKPPPPPREKVPEETIDHFIRMAQPPAPKPVDTDYERHIRKLNRPLPQRSYDRSEEEITAISKAEVEAHFAPKPPPPPREKVPEETIDHFIRMAQPPAPKPVDTDYERHIRKLNRARLHKEASSGSSKQEAAVKKCRKTIPQLGEQAAQSIPSLVVPTTRDSTRAQYYCGQTVHVPEVGNVVITEEHIMQAEVLNITVG